MYLSGNLRTVKPIQPVGEEYFQLGINLPPVLPAARPLFRDDDHGEVQHLEQAVVGGENKLGFDDFSELPVEIFNGHLSYRSAF